MINIELENRKELRNKMQESLELQPGLEKKTRDKIKANEHSINNNTDYKRRLLALIDDLIFNSVLLLSLIFLETGTGS